MSEKPDDTNARKEESVQEFLEAEIKATEASIKHRIIGGVILMVFVFSYLTWMYVSVRKIMVPETMADIAYYRVHDGMPTLCSSVKTEFIRRAPTTVALVGEQVIAALPETRKLAEAKVTDFLNKEMEEIRDQAGAYFREVLLDNGNVIRENLVAMQDPVQGPKIAEELATEMIDKGQAAMETVTQKTFDGFLLESEQVLKDIRDALVRIEQGEKLTHEQATLKRFIQLLHLHTSRNAIAERI